MKGMSRPAPAGRERVAGSLEPRRIVLFRRICGTAPIEGLVLRVAFGQTPGDLGLRQFRSKIERMGTIMLDAEIGKERHGLRGNAVEVAIIDMDAVRSRLDPEIGVPHGGCNRRD